MPQHPGFEPFMFIWVIQVEISEKVPFTTSTRFLYLKVIYFTTEQGYLDWKNWLPTQTTTQARYFSIRSDYGKQKWYNDKVWIQAQLSNQFTNGNWSPNLLP